MSLDVYCVLRVFNRRHQRRIVGGEIESAELIKKSLKGDRRRKRKSFLRSSRNFAEERAKKYKRKAWHGSRGPCSKAGELDSRTVVQLCIWFKEEPSQLSVGQTAQSLTCSIMEKPHRGLDDCPRILLSCFSARNSACQDMVHLLGSEERRGNGDG